MKMRKYKKIYQKIFERNPINNKSEKRMLECWKKNKIGWGGLKCKMLKFNSIFLTDESPIDKENSSWGRKI